MKIGMRNIKTALAVFLSIIVSRYLFHTDTTFHAGTAAIVTMQSSMGNSFLEGRNRFLGTSIGATIGLICSLIKPEDPLLTALGIIVLISICNGLKLKGSVHIGGIAFLAVMLNQKGGDPFFYSINRILETFIGVTVAMTVNYLVKPPGKRRI